MSVLSGSVSRKSNNGTIHRMLKYKFTDLSLSFQVRKRVYELIISFDDNVNYEFEREEIERALVQILKESKQELAYVTRNVFRYDHNSDGIITYEEFTNFCVEHHFGEMAIQRLHREGVYSRGKERIMTRQQFKKTLEYGLSFIQIQPSSYILDTIFNDVDQEQRGQITYSQYFMLLREYFGSQSEAAQTVTVKKVEENLNINKQGKEKPKIIVPNNRNDANNMIQKHENTNGHSSNKNENKSKVVDLISIKSPSERIARIIFHQLKISAIDRDHNRILSIDSSNASQILKDKMQLLSSDISVLVSKLFHNKDTISYEQFVEDTLEFYMCEIVPKSLSYPLNKKGFVDAVLTKLHFVKAKPFESTLVDIFQKSVADGQEQQIDRQGFRKIMEVMFCNYKWPRKTGELRKEISTSKLLKMKNRS